MMGGRYGIRIVCPASAVASAMAALRRVPKAHSRLWLVRAVAHQSAAPARLVLLDALSEPLDNPRAEDGCHG